jgi:hypothetical protein
VDFTDHFARRCEFFWNDHGQLLLNGMTLVKKSDDGKCKKDSEPPLVDYRCLL